MIIWYLKSTPRTELLMPSFCPFTTQTLGTGWSSMAPWTLCSHTRCSQSCNPVIRSSMSVPTWGATLCPLQSGWGLLERSLQWSHSDGYGRLWHPMWPSTAWATSGCPQWVWERLVPVSRHDPPNSGSSHRQEGWNFTNSRIWSPKKWCKCMIGMLHLKESQSWPWMSYLEWFHLLGLSFSAFPPLMGFDW